MRMDTKAKREANRQHLISLYNCDTVTHHPEEDCTICLFPFPGSFGLIIFDGTAGKPTTFCTYRHESSRQQEIARHLKSRKARADYRQQRTEELGSTLTSAALTAKAIRARLKQAFPTVKFAVHSDTFSQGNSVDISYTDGPVASLVSFITDEYQTGTYDSMNDYHGVRSIDPSLGCPGARYVHSQRDQSEARRAELLTHCQAKYGTIPEEYQDGPRFNAHYYENANPDSWAPEYQELHRLQQTERYRREQKAEESQPAAVIVVLSQEEANSPALESSNVVSLSAYRQQKEEQEQQSAADETQMLLATLTNEQLAAAVHAQRTSTDPSRDMIARFLLQELANRDRACAVSVFKASWLYHQTP